jgi:hypothetical protein
MAMHVSPCLLLSLLCLAPTIRADEAAAAPPSKTLNTTTVVSLFEGLAALNSGMAAASPRGFGGAAIVLAPLGCAEGSGSSQGAHWVMCGGFVTLGIYDTTAYGKQYSRRQVFAHNVVAWNLMAGAALITAHYAGSDSAMTKVTQHLDIASQPHGGLHLDWNWTF